VRAPGYATILSPEDAVAVGRVIEEGAEDRIAEGPQRDAAYVLAHRLISTPEPGVRIEWGDRTMTPEESGSCLLAIELLARALAGDDPGPARTAAIQLATIFGKEGDR